MYMEHVKSLTVPELKELAERHGLNTKGKKGQLLTRLAIWVRDEIDSATTGSKANQGQEARVADETANGNHDGGSSDLQSDDDDDEHDEKMESNMNSSMRVDETVADAEVKAHDVLKNATDDDSDDSNSDDDLSDDESDSSVSSEELVLVGGKPCILKAEGDNKGQKSNHCQRAHLDGSQKRVPSEESACSLHRALKTLFGHEHFREGQEWCIRRTFEQKRTLLVAPTGFGKSLCYALPAALLDGVCIVVSPLLSLIQVRLHVCQCRARPS